MQRYADEIGAEGLSQKQIGDTLVDAQLFGDLVGGIPLGGEFAQTLAPFREAEYGGPAAIFSREIRAELVAKLRAEGLTNESIAGTIGVGETTVRRDNRQMADTAQPETRTDSTGRKRPTSYKRTAKPKPKVAPKPPGVEQRQASVNVRPGDWATFKQHAELTLSASAMRSR